MLRAVGRRWQRLLTGGNLAQQLALFYRSMATLYNAGIPIGRALFILARQMEEPSLRQSLEEIACQVQSGRRLSDAMARYGLIFPPLHSNLVALGESTGSLHLILEKLAGQSEKATELRARLRSALAYPMVIFVLAMLLLMFAPAVIFKDLLRLMQDLNVQLPLATKVMVVASRFMTSPFVLIPLIALAVLPMMLWHMIGQLPEWRRKAEAVLLAIPAIGGAVRASVVCTFTRSLATCCGTGVPLLKGLELSAGAADFLVFQDDLRVARARLRDGSTLSEALEESQFFRGMTVQMVAVGEESGRIGDMLERVSLLAEQEVEQTLEVATAALQPLMMLFIGLVVGFVVLATMAPMLQVINSL